MKRPSTIFVVSLLLVALASLAALNAAVAPPADAAEIVDLTAEPLAGPPARQDNNADIWVVGEPLFTSQYPDGFSFHLSASSHAGDIVKARAVWYRPVLRPGSTRQIQAQVATMDAATGDFVASWHPDGNLMLPPWSVLAYQWELRDSAGNQYLTPPQTVEYSDATRAWARIESDDVIVFASDLPSDAEDLIVQALADQRDKFQAVWGALLPYRPRVVLFGNFDAWLAWRTADHNVSDTSYVVGQTFDQWGVIAQVIVGAPSQAAYRDLAYGTVVHEMEHLYQAQFLSGRRRADMPGWFTEGDASFFELQQSYDYLGQVRMLASQGHLPPLLVNPADAPRIDGKNPRQGYDIGYSFFAWMRDTTGGLETQHNLMALLGQDVPFFDALGQALGMPRAEIESAWRVWLGASAAAPTLIPTPTPLPFPQPPTPMTFGSK